MPEIQLFHVKRPNPGDTEMIGSFVPLGAVLVVERRRCLGKRYDENGVLVDCGHVVDAPARRLGRVFKTPHNRRTHAISTVKSPDCYDYDDYRKVTESFIEGGHRTVYVYETTCEACPLCFRPTIDWDAIHEMGVKTVIEDGPLTEPPEMDYAEAVSRRDQIKNQYEAARQLFLASKQQLTELNQAYNSAIEDVHEFARIHQYNRAAKKYDWEVTKPLKIKPGQRTQQREPKAPVIPLPDDEI